MDGPEHGGGAIKCHRQERKIPNSATAAAVVGYAIWPKGGNSRRLSGGGEREMDGRLSAKVPRQFTRGRGLLPQRNMILIRGPKLRARVEGLLADSTSNRRQHQLGFRRCRWK